LNYGLAPDLNQVDILRVVVKENFAEALLVCLVTDIECIDACATAAHVHLVDRSRSQKTSSTTTFPLMSPLLSENTTASFVSPAATKERAVELD